MTVRRDDRKAELDWSSGWKLACLYSVPRVNQVVGYT